MQRGRKRVERRRWRRVTERRPAAAAVSATVECALRGWSGGFV